MTTRKSHTCNLCCANVNNEASGIGVRWTSNRDIELTPPGQAETHICQACIDGLETALYNLRQNERRRDELAATNSTD